MHTTMKSFIFVAVLLGTTCALDRDWANFKLNHKKIYKNSAEEIMRYNLYKARIEEINEHNERYNAGLVTYKKRINKFADMTDDEIKVITQSLRNLSRPKTNNLKHVNSGKDQPVSIDWRDIGAISEVKNQKSCGSCWAFSTTGSIEAHTFIYKNKSVSLSEQQLVDCDAENMGCGGGWPTLAMEYVKENGGIDNESSYPYEGVDRKCRYSPDSNSAQVTGVVEIPSYDESALQDAVANVGPVSVCMDSVPLTFYDSGIIDDPYCRPEYLSHAILAVGYGEEDGIEYWTIKNSWGEDWGENGYFRLRRNANNMCGVATVASYPTV